MSPAYGFWLGYLAAAGAALTLALAALAPAASEGLGPAARLLFWALHVYGALACLSLAQLALGLVPGIERRTPVLLVAAAAALGAAAFTPVALALDAGFDGLAIQDDEGSLFARTVDEFQAFAAPVGLFWLLLNAPRLLPLEASEAPRDGAAAAEAAPAGEGADDAALRALWEKAPRRIGRDLVAMSAELHYLRLRTTKGEALILHPIGRAVAALEAAGGPPGLTIHRSHWVAARHVVDLETEGERMVCVLTGGLRLPVARPRRAALRAALAATAPGEG
ncbi:MAG: LytTR family DNA-binding domain-containing protein [Pikeienuella sp.]|uniref:LytTR family DNA-binding domain-containing protein n=1 Tax=Pikeienuella sp. TaxID=2831957 RepID=UPI00391D531A